MGRMRFHEDKRAAAVVCHAGGIHPDRIARALGVGRTTVYRWLALRRDEAVAVARSCESFRAELERIGGAP